MLNSCFFPNRKFRKKLTSVRRRSAFVIFQAIKPLLNAGKLLTGNKLLKNASELSKPLLDQQQSMPDSTDMTDIQNAGGASTSKGNRTNNTATTVTSTAISNGQSQKCATKIVQQNARKTSKCCDSKKLARSNRDKMLQEKEDFQLAKMLQECIGTSDTSSRYSLRSRFRNKSSVSSSLSSSASSTQDLFQLKYGGNGGGGGAFVGVTTTTTSKLKKSSLPFPDSSSSTNDTTPTRTSTASSGGGGGASRSQRNNSNDNSNDKFMEFSFQKLTRSRRIAMTMSGV